MDMPAQDPSADPAGQDNQQEDQNESAIIDQIGMLLQKLSPDKAKEVVMQLMQMMGGGAQPAGQVSPDAGANGTPVGNT